MTTPQIAVVPPLVATGPLGLCHPCVTARKTDPARQVAEAITLAPVSVQISDGIGQVIGVAMVALPHCYGCLGGGSKLIAG